MNARHIIILVSLGALTVFAGCERLTSRAGAPAAQAEATTIHDLVGPPTRVGERVRDELVLTGEHARMFVSILDESDETTTFWGGSSIHVVETPEISNGEATRVRITNIEDVSHQGGMTLRGETTAPSTDHEPLSRRTVVGTRANGRWTFQESTGVSTDEVREALDELGRDFDLAGEFYQNVRVGESWSPDASATRRFFGDVSIGKGDLTLKLARVEVIDGERQAVIELVAHFEGKTLGDEDEAYDISMSLSGTIYRSLETHLDTRFDIRGSFVLSMDLGLASMRMSGPVVIKGGQTLLTDGDKA